MRITRLKLVTGLLLLAIAVVLRRGLLVVFLALKILGHPMALDAWRGPVLHQTTSRSGIPVDVYASSESDSPILIVHGVNPTGKNSLDLVRISEALAQAGYAVYVPDFAEMKKQHLRPEEAGKIKAVFHSIGRDAAIACFSYGCGPALVAAADPEIRNRVRFAVAFGGYYDIRETLEYVITGAQSLLQIFFASSPEDFRLRLRAGPEALHRRLDALSPSLHINSLRAPLILIHGINDPAIPVQQSIELAKAAHANGIASSLTLLRMYGHVQPILPALGATSLLAFYVPETLRFLSVVSEVVAIQ